MPDRGRHPPAPAATASVSDRPECTRHPGIPASRHPDCSAEGLIRPHVSAARTTLRRSHLHPNLPSCIIIKRPPLAGTVPSGYHRHSNRDRFCQFLFRQLMPLSLPPRQLPTRRGQYSAVASLASSRIMSRRTHPFVKIAAQFMRNHHRRGGGRSLIWCAESAR